MGYFIILISLLLACLVAFPKNLYLLPFLNLLALLTLFSFCFLDVCLARYVSALVIVALLVSLISFIIAMSFFQVWMLIW